MTVRVINGDSREVMVTLPDESVHSVVTSPPYWQQRDYGDPRQLGQEPTPSEFVAALVAVLREARRVLRRDGTLWLNLADSYAGARGGPTGLRSEFRDRAASKQRCRVRGVDRTAPGLKGKDLVGIPWSVALALRADGWWLRSDIIWHKPNAMPRSVRDRPTEAHEYVFLLSRSSRYYYDSHAIAERSSKPQGAGGPSRLRHGVDHRGGNQGHREIPTRETRNARSVWSIGTQPNHDAHFATMAPRLARRCILAGCPPGGTVLDPFGGAGTTGLVADRLGRNAVLIDLVPAFCDMARARISADAPLLATVIP